MKILAIDVGTGTQDIMLYDSHQNLENAVKMVIPSPTRIMAQKIGRIHQNLYIGGDIMGGGSVNRAIRRHMDKGYRVVMEENAARTIRDDLDRVKSMGISIVPENDYFNGNFNGESIKDKYSDFERLNLKDIDMASFEKTFSNFEIEFEFDYLAIAVQDHGFNEKMGDRNFRFLKIREKLNKPLSPEEFAYWDDVPDYFTRMRAVERTLPGLKPLLMDSKFAAICGATYDPQIGDLNSYVVMDVGNGHTTAASIQDGKIRGIFEHHTSSLTPQKIEEYIQKLVDGTITHEEIHQDHGHGAWTLNSIDKLEKVVVTGPRRSLIDKTELPVYHAAPAGDVMMTGPVGLIKSISYKIKK